ncbi:MAG: Dihydrodipicolinate synthetase family [Sedimentibacter sp.]|nr:Dihydrodipicolinate synthetase family [Sedimentibacter sp.]
MTKKFAGGVWPVMLTPFKDSGEVDEKGLEALVNWYIDSGVKGLFAACQSSEIFKLSLEEKVKISEITVRISDGRVPVIASGHTADSLEEQAREIAAIAKTGVEAVVLITNRLAKEHESDDVWIDNFHKLMNMTDPEIKLGFYECPFPYKRLMTRKLIEESIKTGRFHFLKDTCCDAEQIREKLKILKGTDLKLYNANATLLLESLRDGATGYSGVMASFHPELYVWLCENYMKTEADEVQDVLTMCSIIERQLYPVNAKYHLKEIEKLPIEINSRVQDKNLLTETFKKEVQMMNNLCSRTFEQYCK